MQIPNLTLSYLVAELKPLLEASIVRKVQELSSNWFKFKLQTRQGTKDLIVSPSVLFVASYTFPARQTTSGYGAFLRKQLQNKRIESVEQHNLDRIVVINFSDFSLVLELFAKGNLVLVDKEKRIISAYRKEQWKDRTLRKGFAYRFPSSKGLDPDKVSFSDLKRVFRESKKDVVRALVSEINVAPIAAEEICAQAGIGKDAGGSSLGEKELKKIHAGMKSIYSINMNAANPQIVEFAGEKVLLPFKFSLPSLKLLGGFSSLNSALDEEFSASFQTEQRVQEKQLQPKRLQRLEKSFSGQLSAQKQFEEAVKENREKGEAIYMHYAEIRKALDLIGEEKARNATEKEIMYKIKKAFAFVESLKLKERKLVLEFK